MIKKRAIAFVLSLVMILSMAACGVVENPKNTTNTPSTTQKPTETDPPATEFDPLSITEGVTLTIAVQSDNEVEDWNTAKMTLLLEEKFGVDIQFEEYAAGSFIDKMNVMVQGGDKLPDIIFCAGDSRADLGKAVPNWASDGALLELSDFYANPDYAKYINVAIEKEGVDFVSPMRDADGNIWGLPFYYPANNDATGYRLWINEEYAKACGYETLPTTTEEFFDLCKKFVAAGDLNGNGLDDEVIFTGQGGISNYWFKFLMSPFAYAWDNESLVVKDGKVEHAFMTDGWKEGLKYIKQFFDEGLLDTTIITQDKAAYDAVAQDPAMRVLAHIDYRPRMVGKNNLENSNFRLAYSYVPALKGPSGVAQAYYNDPLAGVGAVITSECENPEAAFIVLDYLMSQEAFLINRYGEEGVDWDWWENVDDSKFINGTTKDMYCAENGGEPVFVSYTNAIRWGQGKAQNVGYMLAGPGIDFTNSIGIAMNGGTTEEAKVSAQVSKELYTQCIQDMLKYKPEERIVTMPMTDEESASIAEAAKLIKSYYRNMGAKFVTGELDIDENWDEYIAELEKMGAKDVLKVYQTAYDRTK